MTLDIARQVEPRWNPGTRKVVGATGFEPATPCAQGRCATRLRYAPTLKILNSTALFGSSLVRLLRFPAENCRRTVPEPNSLSQNSRFTAQLSQTPADSLAARSSFSSASRFICNFICETS